MRSPLNQNAFFFRVFREERKWKFLNFENLKKFWEIIDSHIKISSVKRPKYVCEVTIESIFLNFI